MYQNYIFDFYGTVVDFKTEENEDKIWEQMGHFLCLQGAKYDGEELKKVYSRYELKFLSRVKGTQYPDIDIMDVFYRIYREKDIKASPILLRHTARAYRAMSIERLELYEDIIPVFEQLKKRGNRLFLLGNGQRVFLKPEIKYLGLKKYFEQVYVSSDISMMKPDSKVLTMVLEDNKLKKKETIIIGNDYNTDIKMAKKVGVDSVYIHTDSSNNKAKKVDATYTIMDGKHSELLKILS